MHDIKIEILPGRYFFPVLDFKHFTMILVWWSETSLSNFTWETWLIIKPWWPFFKILTFFYDKDEQLFYPPVGERMDS